MAGSHFKKLDDESRALHDSWTHIARIVILVTVLAAAVWAFTSAVRAAVHHASHAVLHLTERGLTGWIGLLGVLAAASTLRMFLGRRPEWKATEGDGMDVALENYHLTYAHEADDPTPRYRKPDFSTALRKAFSTILSLGSGTSGGLEAPSVLMAEGLSSGFARVMRIRSEHELRTYQLAGIAAAVSTLLGAPFSSAIFATEVVYGDRIIYRKLAYALWSGVVAYILSNRLHGYQPLFEGPNHAPVYALGEYLAATGVALAVSVPLAVGFAYAVKRARALVGSAGNYGPFFATIGVGVVALGLDFGAGIRPAHVLGMGEDTMTGVFSGRADVSVWWVLALILVGKVLTTGLTASAGHSVGMLIPSMFLGAVSGALVARIAALLGWAELDPALFAVVGVGSSLVAVVGVPLASVALVLEVFGKSFGPPAILACGVTYLVTLRMRFYTAQRLSPDPESDETG